MSKLVKTLSFGLLPGLFGGDDPQPAPTIITGPEPKTPRKTRMPAETDPSILEAAMRNRKAAMMRRGRESTVMTDNLRETIGSGGQKLGA